MSGEGCGNDQESKVLSTGRSPGVSGMLGRIVGDFDHLGRKLSQPVAKLFLDAHAGNAFLNGLTVTDLYTPAAT